MNDRNFLPSSSLFALVASEGGIAGVLKGVLDPVTERQTGVVRSNVVAVNLVQQGFLLSVEGRVESVP